MRITTMLVMVLAALATLAIPTGGSPSVRVSDRSLRIGGSSNVATASDTSSNGFSLSFVPLFSLLANFIPRILSRFNGVNAYKARSLGKPSAYIQTYDNHDGKLCNPTHLGQWPDTTNCKQFYICQLQNNCSTETFGNEVLTQPDIKEDGDYTHMNTISKNCTTIQIFQCKGRFVYNPRTQKCESELNFITECEYKSILFNQNTT